MAPADQAKLERRRRYANLAALARRPMICRTPPSPNCYLEMGKWMGFTRHFTHLQSAGRDTKLYIPKVNTADEALSHSLEHWRTPSP